MKHPTAQVISISRLTCTKCGAETNAACNCGEAYEVLAERRERDRQRKKTERSEKREENQSPRPRTAGPSKAVLDEVFKRTAYGEPEDFDDEVPVDFQKAAEIYTGTAIELAEKFNEILGEIKLTKKVCESIRQAAEAWQKLASKTGEKKDA